VKYAFIALHRLQFSVRTMCRLLRVHPSGFYTWLKNPLSRRANEDKRQTELLLKAWEESGKVYGYRKLHDDLLDQGEICCPNRVARLTHLAGIKAQIGYKRRPGIYGGRPSVVVDNTLDRQFDVTAPDTAWVTDITYIRTCEGFAYLRRCHRPLFASCDRLGDAEPPNHRCRSPGSAYGRVATQAEGKGADTLGPGLAVHQHGLGLVPQASQSGSLPSRRYFVSPRGEGMSRRGNCHDNAVAESFFNLLKRERIRRRVYRSRDEARQDVFDYIEMFYNPKRKHVRNGMLSPVEFEKQQKI